ncbi:hypothetical protein [Serinibacter salmoneus]|uniref:hypothetical protein n=1 Tax=Serinibacter salmoneus TaxID=556530 RepID=UPI001179C6BF|nr:hypothetical protein [Serinibacter salmoneus]
MSLDADGNGGMFRCYIGGPEQGAGANFILISLPVAPPATTPPSPALLAQRAVDSMQLRAIDIGMAPEPDNADPNILIRMPNQVFAADSGPETTGPNSAEASAGGITVTATAELASVTVDPGDGSATTPCTTDQLSTSTRALEGADVCSVVWERTSTAQPGGTYDLAVTSSWQVEWSGGGEAGTIAFDLVNTRPVAVIDRKVNLVP